MTHQLIRRFQLKGTTKDDNLEHHKAEWQRTVLQMMRDEGYAPLLDINYAFSWTWLEDDKFDFVFTWHGVFVGREKAWQTEGVLDGKMIPSTMKNK